MAGSRSFPCRFARSTRLEAGASLRARPGSEREATARPAGRGVVLFLGMLKPCRLEVRDERMDDRRARGVGRARQDEDRHVAAGPLQQIAGRGCDHHSGERTGEAADANDGCDGTTRECVRNQSKEVG